jgi:hypothetical protein
MSEAPHLDRVFEQRLQQADNGRALQPHGSGQLAEVDRFAQVFFQCPGQTADFFGAPVEPVKRQRQATFGHGGNGDIALEDARQLVKRKQVQRVAQSHQQRVTLFLQHQRLESPRGGLGQQLDHIRPKRKGLEVDKRNAQLRARPLASNSSVMMPVSISKRPIFLPVVRCNSSVCCNCSCEIRRCCTSTSPRRNFSGRPGAGRGASAALAAMFIGVFLVG